MRGAWAEIDLGAVAHNVGVLRRVVAPAEVLAVVKADAYGHGAVPVARAALDAGATWLGVALVQEGHELRGAGIDAPILVLSEPRAGEMADLVANDLAVSLYTPTGIEAAAEAASKAGCSVPVHLKVDTGMRRVGVDPADAGGLAARIRELTGLDLQAVWTHCAVADEPDNGFTTTQLDRFRSCLDDLDRDGIRPPLVHAANSAAGVCRPDARFDLVRCGIAIYGIPPSPELEMGADARFADLRPVMAIKAEVTQVKRVDAGTAVSYGLRYTTATDTVLATVPLGYADGVPRRWGTVGGDVLIGGRRRRVAGVVTMDQFVVDLGPGSDVAAGDEVVVLGEQGDERITANEIGARLDTIGYEIVTGIRSRVPRVYR